MKADETPIDWSFWESQSAYWKPKKGKQYRVVLSKWRQGVSDFGGQSEPKPVVIFDVLKVDKEEYADKPLTWSTASRTLVLGLQEAIRKAEQAGKEAIEVLLRKEEDGRYTLFVFDE